MNLLIAFILFIVLDYLFITFTKSVFENQVIDVQRVVMTMNYYAAIIAYGVLFFALYWFILSRKASVLDAAILGAVINGTFELTNMAIFKKWHVKTVIIDTLWGAVLWGSVTFLAYLK
jgi:uncharacterized membrane protein